MLACPPPDFNPRKPTRIQLPPGSCDCHAHVFGPVEKYPYAEDRTYTPPDALLSQYLHMLDTLGVERAVLVQPSVFGTDNAAILDGIADVGARFRGVAVVEPDVPDKELERLHAAGVRGIRFNVAIAGGLPPEKMEEVAARIRPMGWHLQIFTSIAAISEMEQKLAGMSVPVVVDHMGGLDVEQGLEQPGFQALLRMVRGGNCWVKLSGAYRLSRQDVPYSDVVPYAQALIEAGPERMVWGSDWPHPVHNDKPMPNDGELADLIADWAPDAAMQRRILADNPAQLYGFA